EQAYERVMIPALGLAHRDAYRGRLDADRAEQLRAAMHEQIEDLAERELPGAAEAAVAAKATAAGAKEGGGAEAESGEPSRVARGEGVQILCLPARDEADELAAMMFAQVAERMGFKAEAVRVDALASEMLELVERRKTDIVVISALPPAAVNH